MQDIIIHIDADTAAFANDGTQEVARVLRGLADRLVAGDVPQTLADSNGNACGTFFIKTTKILN